VVLVQGWGYTHVAAEKYAARFAGKGMVAMVIDYRGWGQSNGFTTLANKSLQARAPNDDAQRVTRGEFDIETKRTRLIPLKQVEDVRNAISYLQGEPGVDQEQIGLWGSGFGGGDAIVVAALDARVKAIAMQAPSIAGKGVRYQPYRMTGAILEDAIQRARNGQGAEMPTNHLGRPTIDVETKQMVAEYQPFHSVRHMRERPVLFVIAADDELFDNREHAIAAAAVLDGPKRVIRVPDTTHFEMYVGPAFEMSANAAAEWFVQYLGKNQTNLAR
jgi:dienelactone hydrolase